MLLPIEFERATGSAAPGSTSSSSGSATCATGSTAPFSTSRSRPGRRDAAGLGTGYAYGTAPGGYEYVPTTYVFVTFGFIWTWNC